MDSSKSTIYNLPYLNVLNYTAAPRYGLVNNKPCLERLEPPPGSGGVSQAAATPRYILAVTQAGQCWTHEEGKVGTRALLTLMNMMMDMSLGFSKDP